MTPVKSSNIKAIGYDAKSRCMTVQFQSGTKHDYYDVDPAHHTALTDPKCESVGQYFHKHVRNAHKSTRLADED